MADWISEHKESIQYVVWTIAGLVLIGAGVWSDPNDPVLIAFGLGAIGLPGYQRASANSDK